MIRTAHKEVVKAEGRHDSVARMGTCVVTGRYLPVDFEYSISEPAWRQIGIWHKKLTAQMEKESLKDPDMVKLEDTDDTETEGSSTP